LLGPRGRDLVVAAAVAGERYRLGGKLIVKPRHRDVAVARRDFTAGAAALPRSPPGPKPKGDWPEVLGAWLIMVSVAERADVAAGHPSRLGNIPKLAGDAADFLEEKIGFAPQDTQELIRKIRHFLQFVRS
jgi:hypothetical protein